MNINEKQEIKKLIPELTLMDDEFMRVMFKDNIPLAQFVLRILTHKDDLIITDIETQRDLKKLAGSRSICLDALGTDSKGKKYDLEIQRSNKGADPYRARYHLGALDVENLGAGTDFSELPETYIIFVTERDYFHKGKGVYKIERVNIDAGEPFNDGEHILYINGEYRGDDALGRLMHDFNCPDPNNMYFKHIADRARYNKSVRSTPGTHADSLCPRGRGATAQKARLSTLVGSKLKGRVATKERNRSNERDIGKFSKQNSRAKNRQYT